MSVLLMISTAGSEKEARKIAKKLVEARLAACVNLIPGVTSLFYWEGKLCQDRETMILIKTAGGQCREIINEIKKIHSYEVPEMLFFRADAGEKRYLQWVSRMVGGKRKKNIDNKNKKS
jgi:periplasmic divalent cation tolerance protein